MGPRLPGDMTVGTFALTHIPCPRDLPMSPSVICSIPGAGYWGVFPPPFSCLLWDNKGVPGFLRPLGSPCLGLSLVFWGQRNRKLCNSRGVGPLAVACIGLCTFSLEVFFFF